MGVLTAVQETVARHSSTICSGILYTFLGGGALNVEIFWAAHHPSVFSMSEHVAFINWCWWIWKAVCECDSTEDQTADWRLKISPKDASVLKPPSCVNWLRLNDELKVVKTHLYVCAVKPEPQPDLLLPNFFVWFVWFSVELQYIRTEVVLLILYSWISFCGNHWPLSTK